MNKRRLSKQQQNRISKQQERTLGETDTAVAGENCNGRVVSCFGRQVQVETLSGEHQGETSLCHQRANLPELVTGDLVVWEATDDGGGVILARAERRNEFRRADSRGREKSIAANLDCVLVVFAAVPQPFANLIDRYLVALENLDLPLRLVLNKTDLLTGTDKGLIDNMLSIYQSLDYPVDRVSAASGAGIPALEAALDGLTTVLVGQSGVGKSSLINALGGGDLSVVGELSAARGKGTHTTTAARLHHLRHCDLIDSPGIREFRVENLSAEQILYGFREMRGLLGHCRFRNCSHQGEAGCALAAAMDRGEIHPQRWQSYLLMRGEAGL